MLFPDAALMSGVSAFDANRKLRHDSVSIAPLHQYTRNNGQAIPVSNDADRVQH
jgi:hypothetical protein